MEDWPKSSHLKVVFIKVGSLTQAATHSILKVDQTIGDFAFEFD